MTDEQTLQVLAADVDRIASALEKLVEVGEKQNELLSELSGTVEVMGQGLGEDIDKLVEAVDVSKGTHQR